MTAWLELQLTSRGRHLGKPLLNPADIESVRPAYHRIDEIGSLIRTRSGETHCVAERVNKIKQLMQRILSEVDA